MFELLYSSAAVTALNTGELELLLSSSRASNKADGLTGCLVHVHDDDGRSAFFVQILEGEQEKVEAVYRRIAMDELHSQVTVLHSGPITARRFSGWSMRLAELSPQGILAAAGSGRAGSAGPGQSADRGPAGGSGQSAGSGQAAVSGQSAGLGQSAGPGRAGASVEAVVRDRRAMVSLLASYGETTDSRY